jgi:hypothetical protein
VENDIKAGKRKEQKRTEGKEARQPNKETKRQTNNIPHLIN